MEREGKKNVKTILEEYYFLRALIPHRGGTNFDFVSSMNEIGWGLNGAKVSVKDLSYDKNQNFRAKTVRRV